MNEIITKSILDNDIAQVIEQSKKEEEDQMKLAL